MTVPTRYKYRGLSIMEIWKSIPGTNNKYWVSDQGRVKSCRANGIEYIMKPTLDNRGYHQCTILRKSKKIHHLVARTFLGDSILCIDHKNCIKTDNRLENLEYVTVRENTLRYKCTQQHTSKYRGVCWNKRAKKWRATIWINNKTIHLGYYTRQEEASAAYEAKLKEVNTLPA